MGMNRNLGIIAVAALLLFLPSTAAAQHDHHGHHGPHTLQKDVRITVHQVAEDAIQIRIGPFNLPAHTPHDAMPQAQEFYWDVPFDGWLLSYAPSLVDEAGNDVPSKLLHHVAFWNTGRSDFLCPNKEEHIFGAGGEMNHWPPLLGFGYAVHHGERIRINTMFHNPTGASYPKAHLEVQINYLTVETVQAGVPEPRSVYPVWLDVMQCGESGYDLKPGDSVTSGQFTLQQSGLLLGLGGHLHDYGQALTVVNLTRKEEIAKLSADLDATGQIRSMPVATYISRGGYRLASGDKLQVSAAYHNPTKNKLPDGAMGIAVGYFLPDDPAAMHAFRRAQKEGKKGQ
jgi:hypothetical protein